MALNAKHIIDAGGAVPAFLIGSKNGFITKDTPTVVENVYWKVTHINADKDNISALVTGYANDKQYALAHKNIRIKTNLEGDNFIKQVYLHMKTMPEFANAQDC